MGYDESGSRHIHHAESYTLIGLALIFLLGLLAFAGAFVLGCKVYDKLDADIKTSRALERIAAASERAFPDRSTLPRPSLLDAYLKPIPTPDDYCSSGDDSDDDSDNASRRRLPGWRIGIVDGAPIFRIAKREIKTQAAPCGGQNEKR